MDHNQNLQRIIRHMTEKMNAEVLKVTLGLDYTRMPDVAARLITEYGADLTGAQIDLGVYALSNHPDCQHLFAPLPTTEGPKDEKPTTQLCGMPRDQFLSLPPTERMRIADADEAAKRANTAATHQAEADAMAFASRPPGFESWSAERRLQHSNEAAALARKQREKKVA